MADEEQTSLPEDFSRQLAVIRLSVFSASLVRLNFSGLKLYNKPFLFHIINTLYVCKRYIMSNFVRHKTSYDGL